MVWVKPDHRNVNWLPVQVRVTVEVGEERHVGEGQAAAAQDRMVLTPGEN